MKRVLFLMSMMLIFGMVGSASAVPIFNDGSTVAIQYDGNSSPFGTYINSGTLLFTASGNNEGAFFESVEQLIENYMGYSADFELTEAPMTWTGTNETTGTWSVNSPVQSINFYAVKAGNGYAMYLVNPVEGTGSWSAYDLWTAGCYNSGNSSQISHFNGYNPVPVPEPSTIILLGLGILGLVGGSKLRKKS